MTSSHFDDTKNKERNRRIKQKKVSDFSSRRRIGRGVFFFCVWGQGYLADRRFDPGIFLGNARHRFKQRLDFDIITLR